MKIVIIAPWLLESDINRGGGIELIDYEISKRLKERGCKVIQIGPKPHCVKDDDNHYVQINSIKQYPIINKISKYISVVHMIFYLLYLYKYHAQDANTYDAAIIHNGAPGLISLIVYKTKGVPCIFSEGNLEPWITPLGKIHNENTILSKAADYYGKIIAVRIAKESDIIRVQSAQLKDSMKKEGIDEKQIRVIPAGADIKEFSSVTKIKTNNITIGYIGRLSDEKGVNYLIKLIQYYEKKDDINFIILGDGPYYSEIKGLNNVIHVGKVNHQELPDWLSKIDVVVFFQNDCGIAEIETMIAGKYIIAVDTEGVREIFSDQTAKLVTLDINEYICAIDNIINGKVDPMETAERAKERGVALYDWETITSQWENIINEVVN